MKISKRSINKLIYVEIWYVLISQIFVSHFGLPSSISYICDLCNVVILFYVCMRKRKQSLLKAIGAKPLYICLVCLSTFLLLGALINFVKPALVIWATRNTYRFFLFFFACIFLLERNDVETILELLCKFQIPNVILTLYQFLALGKSQDYLGGIFGMEVGCNASTNIYLCIIVVYVIAKYLYKKTSMRNVAWIVVSSLVIAALAELKIFFVEFFVIVFFSILLSKPSVKMLGLLLGAIAGLAMGLYVFSQLFPDAYAILVQIDRFVEYNTTIILGYNISRWGAFREINELFFHDNIFLNLCGFGFGNCEYSSFPLFTSEFYLKYGFYHYRWFAHQMWFLEGGYIGFGLYFTFFILIFFWGSSYKDKLEGHKEYGLLAQLVAIISAISLWYNASTRVEIAYILFFALAAPYAVYKSERKNAK